MAQTTSADPGIDEIELPAGLAEVFQRLGDRETPPATLRDGFRIVEETLDRAAIELELADMYQSEPTRHAVHVDDRVEHVPCVMDAMIVALALDERPVEIVSQPPTGGETVEFFVDDGTVTVVPESAVVSFGIAADDAEAADLNDIREILNEDPAVPRTCTLINAFPDSDEYERWATDQSSWAVMELGVVDLVALSRNAADRYSHG
jgi:hypothetical protein